MMVLKFYVLTAQSFASFQNDMFPTEFFDRKIYKRVEAHAKLELTANFLTKTLKLYRTQHTSRSYSCQATISSWKF